MRDDTKDEIDTLTVEGIFVPEYCPRGIKDCKSLSQVIAAGHASFICCGEHGQGKLVQDKYRVCFKNAEIDDQQDFDKRDITQTLGVLAGALSVIEEKDSGLYHDPSATTDKEDTR